jgi:hypothetical protein
VLQQAVLAVDCSHNLWVAVPHTDCYNARKRLQQQQWWSFIVKYTATAMLVWWSTTCAKSCQLKLLVEHLLHRICCAPHAIAAARQYRATTSLMLLLQGSWKDWGSNCPANVLRTCMGLQEQLVSVRSSTCLACNWCYCCWCRDEAQISKQVFTATPRTSNKLKWLCLCSTVSTHI